MTGGPGILLSDVQPQEVKWFWQGRIPLGKVTVLDGDPGTAKSTMSQDLAARVTTGREMPDGTPGVSGGVVLISAEDDLADTIRPRLDAAGADPSRVLALSTVPSKGGERPFSIPGDLPVLEETIKRISAVLVVIDPLAAFLDGRVDSNRDQDVRQALWLLAELAKRTGAAIVVIRHLNKKPGMRAIYRGGGSIGIIGAARSGLLAAKRRDSGDLALAIVKNNLCAPAPTLRYRVEETAGGIVRVVWLGVSAESADDLLAEPAPHATKRQEACVFIQEKLEGGPRPSRELERLAQEKGIAEKTLRRARQELGIESWQTGDG